jgi:hypothetical protein
VKRPSFVFLILFLLIPSTGLPWSEKAHTFIAAQAGMKSPEFSNLPDLIRKDNYDLYAPLHIHFAAPGARITSENIDKFKIRTMRFTLSSGYKAKLRVPDPAGVLYWNIIDVYRKLRNARGWEYQYYLFNFAHFVADLSQPLHNYPWGDHPASDGKVYPEIGAWSKDNHRAFDKSLDKFLPPDSKTKEILEREIQKIEINSARDLKKEVLRIANSALDLANKCYAERRQMTREEGLRQIAMSISLLRAVMADTKDNIVEVFELPD